MLCKSKLYKLTKTKQEIILSETKKISRYPVPELNDMPEDIKETILGFKENLGFIPNVLVALAHRPDEFRAFLAYNNALMNKESGLTPADKEMIIIAFSSQNGCQYCVQSHGAALRLASEMPNHCRPGGCKIILWKKVKPVLSLAR